MRLFWRGHYSISLSAVSGSDPTHWCWWSNRLSVRIVEDPTLSVRQETAWLMSNGVLVFLKVVQRTGSVKERWGFTAVHCGCGEPLHIAMSHFEGKGWDLSLLIITASTPNTRAAVQIDITRATVPVWLVFEGFSPIFSFTNYFLSSDFPSRRQQGTVFLVLSETDNIKIPLDRQLWCLMTEIYMKR